MASDGVSGRSRAEVLVIDRPGQASVALEPVRASILRSLREGPASAAALAARLGLPRQRVGYHVGLLRNEGLVEDVETRRHGGLVERVVRLRSDAIAIAPDLLDLPPHPAPPPSSERLSAAYAVSVAARAVREIGQGAQAAADRSMRLPVLTIDADIRLADAAGRAAFAADLADAVASVVARHHHEDAPAGRSYRLVVLSHPSP